MTSNSRTCAIMRLTNLSVLSTASLFILALLTGCFGGPPGEDEARSDLQELIRSRSDDAIQLTGLRKVNGQSREAMGVRIYKMEVEGRIEILENCYWNPPDPMEIGTQFSVSQGGAGGDDYWDKFRKKSSGLTRGSKGEQHSFMGSLFFEEKESGWHLSKAEFQMQRGE